MSKSNMVIGAVILLCVIYSALTVTVVEEGQEAALTGEVVFDPSTATTDFWEQHSQTYFTQNAVDLNTLLQEAGGDFASVAGKYGHYSMGDSGELSFIVKGTGVVDVVKNHLRAGYLGFKLEGYGGDDIDFRLQIGPVFKGSAVRDSISMISYEDYKNQIEWAQVSVAFHDLIQRDLLSKFDMEQMMGKTIDFIGCFTVGRPSQMLITPVELKVN